MRKKQCKACPWKVGTDPDRDIPGGYSRTKHEALRRTVATPGEFSGVCDGINAMACHESPPGKEDYCVGWVVNQLGAGNNIALRIQALDGRFSGISTDGPQHQTFEGTLGLR